MKKILITILIMTSISKILVAQNDSNSVYNFFGVYNGSMKLLNFYFEYGSGDLSGLGKDFKNKRMLENLDSKLTYLQTLKSVPWLGFGFTLQAQFDNPSIYDPSWREGSRNGKNTSNPLSMLELGGNIFFLNIFNIGFSSSGDIVLSIYWNKKLPDVSPFKSHTLTFAAKQSIFIRGNQYVFDEITKQNKLTQGWYDGSEFRIAYQMKFTDYFALRPEFQFCIFSSAQIDFKNSYWIRFNPRLQFFLEDWTLFVEPRIFYGDMFKKDLSSLGISYSDFNKNGWAFEIKVGIDLTRVFFD